MTPEEMSHLHRLCFTTPRPWRAAEFTGFLNVEHTLLCTSERGFILGRVLGPQAEILTLAVHPETRRQGVGRGLVAEFEARACERGADEVFLEVAEDNGAALELYRARGYVRAGFRRDYYASSSGQKSSALVLRHALPRVRADFPADSPQNWNNR
jgi:[ribosomal protein S18]-alanine N-acetyltransferase